MPNNFSEIDWEKNKGQFRKLILQQLEDRTGFKGIENHIEVETVFTPYNWEHDLNIYKGATFSLAHNLPQMMYFRPHNRVKEIDRVVITPHPPGLKGDCKEAATAASS